MITQVSGKGRGRGFISDGACESQGCKGAPPPPFGAARGLISGEGSADRCRAPPVANGSEKRKSDVISPMPPVDGVGEVKRRQTGRTLDTGAGIMVSVPGYMMDSGLTTLAAAGVAPIPSVLAGGTIPGFQGPIFWNNPEGSFNTRFDDTSFPPFIVLLECRILGNNLGRFNLIALGDLFDSLIPDTKRQVSLNG